MKAERVVDLKNFFRADAKTRAHAGIVIIGVWYERVQTVVAAGHLEDDQDRAVATGSNLGGFVGGVGLQRRKGVREESGNSPGDGGTERGRAEKFAASFEREIFHTTLIGILECS